MFRLLIPFWSFWEKFSGRRTFRRTFDVELSEGEASGSLNLCHSQRVEEEADIRLYRLDSDLFSLKSCGFGPKLLALEPSPRKNLEFQAIFQGDHGRAFPPESQDRPWLGLGDSQAEKSRRMPCDVALEAWGLGLIRFRVMCSFRLRTR